MTVRPRYTYRRKARDLATLARMTADSARPILEAAAAVAHIILTRRYLSPKDDR